MATGCTGGFFAGSATLATGLVALTGAADLEAGLLTVLGAGFSTYWATLPAFAAGLPGGLAAGCALVVAVVGALLLFPGIAFTSCLLAERFCAWSVVPAVPPRLLEVVSGGASSARECTGFPVGKPISCKSETIIWLSIRKKVNPTEKSGHRSEQIFVFSFLLKKFFFCV